MNIIKYVVDNALELIPALYIIGLMIKGTEKIKDKYIPIILLPLGILGSITMIGMNSKAVIQGILVTGVAVYTNQLVKQICKKE